MKIIKPSVEIMTRIDGMEILKHIERCGRTCYKSEDKITNDSCVKFAQQIIKRGHEAVIEHYNITVKFICDRGVSHELVRHRIASFAQESTRYCQYGNNKFGGEITVIKPCYFEENSDSYILWKKAMGEAEANYLKLVNSYHATAQEARSVLPNSLKTEIVMTANLKEWRAVLKLRTSPAAHPQMVEIMDMLLKEFKEIIPIIFDDIGDEINV
ncbi:MAG: FAD-dependent thymidylate synthase [Bacteroides sp.]